MIYSLISTVVGNLSTILKDEMVLLSSVPKEVEELQSTFTWLQALLEDAEGRRVNDKPVILWLEKLKDLAYDVEDILDEWRTEALRSQADEEDGSRSILNKVSSSSDSVILRHNIGTRIKEAKQRLDDIAKVTGQLGLNVDSTVRQSIDSEIRSLERRERETSSLVDASSIVGRKDDVTEVMGLLMGESSQDVSSERKGKRKRSEDEHEVPVVVSIVGMGGLGKTTLAQLLCNDEKVRQHFEMRMWVCVSEDFDVKRVTQSIIESAARCSCALQDLDTMQHRLREELHRRRFLLVLDDVWSEESEKWEKLKVPLQAGAAGSRVIITTRSQNVASAMGSTHVRELPILSDDDCWSLFCQRAFVHQNGEDHLEFEKIGRKIVKKCGGVPLAAKVIGSVMRTKRAKREWEHALQSETWSSHNVLQRGILPALLLSYYDLPSPLKRCFAYCSLFSKDELMGTAVLVKLWMAQGFIGSEGSEDMEEIGGRYIDELVRRSLFQDVKLDDEGNIDYFKMHDLVHDLAQFVARGECLSVEKGKADVDLRKVRHATVFCENASIIGVLCKAEKLRTMIFLRTGSEPHFTDLPPNFFDQLRSLRALSLTKVNKLPLPLPQIIGKLRHLRHLDLSVTNIVELPEIVTDLYNLQTLSLCSCSHLRKLPERLGKLINLRHLELERTDALRYLPRGIGRLTALRTLEKFIVGDGQKQCGLGELKNLNHLQGMLIIEGLEKVMHMEEAREAELDKKQYLSHLSLLYNGKEKVNGMLESLRPHSNLKFLSIQVYLGSTLPMWIEDPSFSNLAIIELSRCVNCKQLPCLGKLPFLKSLDISGMVEVKHVGVEFCGADDDSSSSSNCGGGVSFPKLEKLTFFGMGKWEGWELRGGVVMMPSLLDLEISGCRKLKALPENLPLSLKSLTLAYDSLLSFEGKLPAFPNLENLEISGCDGIKSIPSGLLGYGGKEKVNGMLESLRPHSNLKLLSIEGFLGSTLPGWIEDPSFSNLVTIELFRCVNCKQLPCLGKLPFLKSLEISGMVEVRHVGVEFCGADDDDTSSSSSNCGDSVSFPRLEKLAFDGMEKWEEWELRGGVVMMPSLLDLEIFRCPKLKALPENLPLSLKSLTLKGDYLLSFDGKLPAFPNLENLTIFACGGIKSIPGSWLGELKALEGLWIRSCHELECLPEEMQHLTMLKKLIIDNCPRLKERCKVGGEDWHKIAHIPNVYVYVFE